MRTAGMPEKLHLVESLANSLDVEGGLDDFESVAKARAWVEAHGVGRVELTTGDVERLRAFRDGLRALLLANHGEPVDARAIAAMNESTGGALLAVGFDEFGNAMVHPQGSGANRVLAEMLKGILSAMGDGSWERLKICRNDDCAVAFYDVSKNRSRSWCSMAVCGNRMKVRSFRQRRAGKRA